MSSPEPLKSDANPETGDAPEISADPLADVDSVPEDHTLRPHETGNARTAMLTLGALGVVFGDIGTSPLYAARETVLSTAAVQGHPGSIAVMGAISMIFWALILVVTVKYVTLIMRADNNGEGGVLALATRAHRSPGIGRGLKTTIGIAAILGLALFFGDGMLTPAITVLSAVEGLGVASKGFQHLIMPIAILILVLLFAFQSRGTAKIGRLFGPIMLIWFLTLAALGVLSIIKAPEILLAVNPYYAGVLITRDPWVAFVALGSVVLAVTGCEALYADMGHFGKTPIRLAWLCVGLPALLMNYFGQGAAILLHPNLAPIAFYSVVPPSFHFPMLVLSTVASIIASQAVISGVFSITRQAVQLGQLPRMEVRHTSATDVGQIYVPRMNAFLLVGVVLIVLIFRTSSALAAAYGIAVTGVMAIDTFHASLIATRQWQWQLKWVIPLFGMLGLIDLLFLVSNSMKVIEGGWLPLGIAAAVFFMMETWRLGRRAHLERIRNESMPLALFLERADKTPVRVAGTAVFLSARPDGVPGALLHNLKHNKVLHERVVLLHVTVEDTPFVDPAKRIEVKKLGKGFYLVDVHRGFFEVPDVPKSLEEARRFGLAFDVETATFFIGHETLVPGENPPLGRLRTWLYTTLASSALSPARFYNLPPNRVVELGTQVTV